MEALVELYNVDEERLVCGHHDCHARTLRSLFGVAFLSRAGSLKIIGEEEAVETVKRLVYRVLEIHRDGGGISDKEVARLIEETYVREKEGAEPDKSPVRLLNQIRPKSKGQERYVQCISENEITLGIGPAGTGKTVLAVAAAIAMLKDGLYRKLILTRPAVEAGEKLGFLPGDYQAKVDPYLRPLYDAIESFLDVNRFNKYH